MTGSAQACKSRRKGVPILLEQQLLQIIESVRCGIHIRVPQKHVRVASRVPPDGKAVVKADGRRFEIPSQGGALRPVEVDADLFQQPVCPYDVQRGGADQERQQPRGDPFPFHVFCSFLAK